MLDLSLFKEKHLANILSKCLAISIFKYAFLCQLVIVYFKCILYSIFPHAKRSMILLCRMFLIPVVNVEDRYKSRHIVTYFKCVLLVCKAHIKRWKWNWINDQENLKYLCILYINIPLYLVDNGFFNTGTDLLDHFYEFANIS